MGEGVWAEHSLYMNRRTQTSIVSNANWHRWSRPARCIFLYNWACHVCWNPVWASLTSWLSSRYRFAGLFTSLSLWGRLNSKSYNTAREVKASHIVYNSAEVLGRYFFSSFLEEKRFGLSVWEIPGSRRESQSLTSGKLKGAWRLLEPFQQQFNPTEEHFVCNCVTLLMHVIPPSLP